MDIKAREELLNLFFSKLHLKAHDVDPGFSPQGVVGVEKRRYFWSNRHLTLNVGFEAPVDVMALNEETWGVFLEDIPQVFSSLIEGVKERATRRNSNAERAIKATDWLNRVR